MSEREALERATPEWHVFRLADWDQKRG